MTARKIKPYVLEKLPTEREDWLKQRRLGIGGSDAAAALGMSPYKSKFTLYCEKTGMISDDVEDNEAMRLGRDLEEYVAKRFCEAAGKKIRRSGYCYVSKENPFMRANVDRLIVGEEAGLECKTTSALTRTKYDKGDIPIQYYLQCLHYMAVTGYKRWYIAILVMGKGFYWYTVERDEAEIKVLIDNERAFWELLKSDLPPLPDGSESSTESLKELYPSVRNDFSLEIDDMEEKIERHQEIDGLIEKLKVEKKEIENQLKYRLQDSPKGWTEKYIISWKPVESQRVDSKKLKEKYPSIYAEVLKTSSYRKFGVKELKGE